jgi:hypothetical protein
MLETSEKEEFNQSMLGDFNFNKENFLSALSVRTAISEKRVTFCFRISIVSSFEVTLTD